MRRHRTYEALWLSFFSRSLYRDVAQCWGGIAAGYLVLLATISWAPVAISMQRQALEYSDARVAALFAGTPAIQIHDGVVTFDPPGRHEIRDAETGTLVAILDVDGDLAELDGLEDEVVMLTRSKFVLHRARRGETRSYDLSEVESFSVASEDLVRWVNAIRRWGTLLVIPLLVMCSLVYRLLQTAALGGLGVIAARVLHAELSYAAAVRVAAVAITPAVLFDAGSDLLGLQPPPRWTLLSAALNVGFLIFGVTANRPIPTPVSPTATAARS
jgi:hypothetical protein